MTSADADHAPAADYPEAAFPPIEPGDFAPNFELFGPDGERFALYDDTVVGRPVVLVLVPGAAGEDRASAVTDLVRRILDHPAAREATVAVIGQAPVPGIAETGLSALQSAPANGRGAPRGRMLIDETGRMCRSLGAVEGGASVIVLDPQCRVAARLDAAEGAMQAERALQVVERIRESRGAGLTRPHPPVLWISSLLDPAECRSLIGVWERHRRGNGDAAGDRGGVPEAAEAQMLQHLGQKMARRVIPQILKAFQYRVTRRESFHIACFDGSVAAEGGPRRANSGPKFAHRRFTMSLSLGTEDYEGGEFRFPEYGDQLYRPETGEALVFSSALLHEVTPVTAGRRFVLLSHFVRDEDRSRPAAAAPAPEG